MVLTPAILMADPANTQIGLISPNGKVHLGITIPPQGVSDPPQEGNFSLALTSNLYDTDNPSIGSLGPEIGSEAGLDGAH